ncbi:hypothetical protein X271_00310 [Candidatus Hepatoplasma crinochetorum Av]|uniref:Uncharacterized protein n=1 Tax=Candidatus Hepatoplasma crinochetorum Av TaxID=1427984 RepID=W8GN43_9MOLU|nr:hypothetical protein [Candidatus Hepatoplasma crinochetorum]AHK22416.1 hypothetical protein X271_00310 [Candidatus Hepatoplasma crinochetorum Av]
MDYFNFEKNINLVNLTNLYFKKMMLSFWFYILVIFIPFLFCISFFTNTPSYLVIDSVFAFSVVFNVLIFYGILFFNVRRSHFYILITQKFNNNKIYVYLPIFLNLIIVVIFTFTVTLFITYLFLQFDLMSVPGWNSPDHYYHIRSISDYRWGIFIYYLIIFFLITFVLAFLIQNLSKTFNRFMIISIFLFVLFVVFSGTLEISAFLGPVPSSNPNDILYSYNQDSQIVTFKPYFNRNDPLNIQNKYFYKFTFRNFMQMINPYYWITKWGQYDMLFNNYRNTTLLLPGIGLPNNQLIIDVNDPSTWVLFKYQMFSFKCLLWSSYILVPYLFILFYGFLGIFIAKKEKNI